MGMDVKDLFSSGYACLFCRFLFWSADTHPKPKVGLYRLDLANISNGIKHDVNPKLLRQEANLGAFTVDYAKYRLIVSSEGKNTVNSVSFDG